MDGHLDIFKTHFQLQPSGLYRNLGKGEFEDQAMTAGLATERTYVSWGTNIVDLDNDGFPDIFWVTGNVYAEIERVNPRFPYKGPRVVFRNRGDGTFVRIKDQVGPAIGALHAEKTAEAQHRVSDLSAEFIDHHAFERTDLSSVRTINRSPFDFVAADQGRCLFLID